MHFIVRFCIFPRTIAKTLYNIRSRNKKRFRIFSPRDVDLQLWLKTISTTGRNDITPHRCQSCCNKTHSLWRQGKSCWFSALMRLSEDNCRACLTFSHPPLHSFWLHSRAVCSWSVLLWMSLSQFHVYLSNKCKGCPPSPPETTRAREKYQSFVQICTIWWIQNLCCFCASTLSQQSLTMLLKLPAFT